MFQRTQNCSNVARSSPTRTRYHSHNILKVSLCWAPPRDGERYRNEAACLKPEIRLTTCHKTSIIVEETEKHWTSGFQEEVPRGGAKGLCQTPLPCPFPASFLQMKRNPRSHRDDRKIVVTPKVKGDGRKLELWRKKGKKRERMKSRQKEPGEGIDGQTPKTWTERHLEKRC